MSRLIIHGGKQLHGAWPLSGNKNEALPLISASLLFGGGLTIKNIPDITDVRVMMKIRDALESTRKFPSQLSSHIRGSLLFIGPLLALHGRATIPRSGGDKIGLRSIDTHLEVFKAFGAKIKTDHIVLPKNEYQKSEPIIIWLSEPSVTATENALLLASLRTKETIIKNAASEPHVVGLGRALESGGVNIEGLGTNFIRIKGVKKLVPTEHIIGEDFMELCSVLILSALFGGRVSTKIQNPEQYEKIFEAFRKFERNIICKDGIITVATHEDKEKSTRIEEISDGPWPSFPSDFMSPMIVLATQCRGQYLFHEKMFESRLYFTDKLKSFGAQLVLCDPHRVLIAGPSKLKGTHIESPDIRAGMALLIAALVANGESIIENVEQLDRGYENLVTKLRNIGADITRED